MVISSKLFDHINHEGFKVISYLINIINISLPVPCIQQEFVNTVPCASFTQTLLAKLEVPWTFLMLQYYKF